MDVCIYFQVHQPNRLKRYTFFDLGRDHLYEDDKLNKDVLDKVSEKCYLPANDLLLKLIKRSKGKFKIAFSLSGVFIEQLEYHRPDVLRSFQELAKTGCVEFLSETYYHSLASVYSKREFEKQVASHRDKIEHYFKQTPTTFRNTELIYSDDIARFVSELGYETILTEGVKDNLDGRSPNAVFRDASDQINVLLKNYKLSDDVAFRFGNEAWKEHPLTAEKFISWVKKEEGDTCNLFMDYETIGEHKWEDTGIFEFWDEFVEQSIRGGINFKFPKELSKGNAVYEASRPISWADTERDLSAWNGNLMQEEALQKIYALEPSLNEICNEGLWHVWRKLQTSDHFYYMCTKHENDGAVHAYFSPYGSPHEAYLYYMNVVSDLEIVLQKELGQL